MIEELPNGHVMVRPLSSKEDAQKLILLAREDEHTVLFPTHLVTKHGEIVGYGSINAMPMVNVWLHSHKVKARDSLHLLNIAENIAANAGLKQFVMPCSQHSPFFPHMEKLGFKRLGFAELNIKTF